MWHAVFQRWRLRQYQPRQPMLGLFVDKRV
jgi:hypothetical protein